MNPNERINTPVSAPLVAIVDDDCAVRDGLALLLGTVGLRTYSYPDAITFLDDSSSVIDCVLLDIRMPGMSGLDALDCLSERRHLPIIVLSAHGNLDTCRRAFKRGAFDFLRKPVDDDELIDAVQQAIREGARTREHDDVGQRRAARIATLSGREREVLDGIVSGLSNKEIARNLVLSPRTVETYRANVFDKLQVSSVVELVRDYAVPSGVRTGVWL
jgi:FixJ family two-component response regulator